MMCTCEGKDGLQEDSVGHTLVRSHQTVRNCRLLTKCLLANLAWVLAYERRLSAFEIRLACAYFRSQFFVLRIRTR